MKTQNNTPELIGKYINKVLWSDVEPIGKIVALKGKYKVIVQKVEATENKTKMEFERGGFSFHCPNNHQQRYDFFETDEFIELSISESNMKKSFLRIGDSPRKFYDYNF